MALLEVSNLDVCFALRRGEVKALRGVSFTLDRGERLGIVGESGAGKSVAAFTILNLIAKPGYIAGGSIRFDGRELTTMKPRELQQVRGNQISMIFQDPMMTLNPVLTIGQQMQLALNAHEKLSKAAARARSAEALTRVGIPDAEARLDAYPHQFSGGMRQRVAIAIALLHGTRVIVADEPTTALDVSIQAQILSEMRELAREMGTALVWISHDLSTVSALADRILVMYAGRIVEEGPTAQVLRSPRHPYTAGLLRSLPAMAEPGTDLEQIPGTTPSLLNLPQGCPFRPRCDRATDLCSEAPPMTPETGRGYRCHHPLLDGTPA